jgi:hypothetical protein
MNKELYLALHMHDDSLHMKTIAISNYVSVLNPTFLTMLVYVFQDSFDDICREI